MPNAHLATYPSGRVLDGDYGADGEADHLTFDSQVLLDNATWTAYCQPKPTDIGAWTFPMGYVWSSNANLTGKVEAGVNSNRVATWLVVTSGVAGTPASLHHHPAGNLVGDGPERMLAYVAMGRLASSTSSGVATAYGYAGMGHRTTS